MMHQRHNRFGCALRCRRAARFAFGAARVRGIAFVAALAVIVVIASVLMVLVRHVQTEQSASANHGSATEARWIVEGVARALFVELARDPRVVEPGRAFDAIEVDAGRMGDGIYWLLAPDLADEQRYTFGIVSEAGKINVNTADAETLESLHPGITPAVAESILAWRGDAPEAGSGAASGYYLAQQRPYRAKEAPFETIGELLLVRDVDRALLFGPRRAQREGLNGASVAVSHRYCGHPLQRGLAPAVTVFSREPNRASDGAPRVNINSTAPSEVAEALREQLGETRGEAVAAAIVAQRPYRHVLECLMRIEMDEDEAALLYDHMTTSNDSWLPGLVDISTAPPAVLDALPGLEPGDGDGLAAAREGVDNPTATPLWVVDALGPEKATEIGGAITTRSMQFSADILAVSGDGRAFFRMRTVIDVSPVLEGDAPRILYSEALTHLGWPLNRGILEALRAGESAADVARRYRGQAGRF